MHFYKLFTEKLDSASKKSIYLSSVLPHGGHITPAMWAAAGVALRNRS